MIQRDTDSAVITHGSIVPFCIAVLLRLAGLDVADLDASSVDPGLENPTDVLWTVITAYFLGVAAPFDKVLQARITQSCLPPKDYLSFKYWRSFSNKTRISRGLPT